MAASSLSELLAGAGETLTVEYKSWLELSEHEARANLARHIAAIANSGGGYIVFGVDDQTRLPLGEPPSEIGPYSQDDFASIVKKYLDPRVQVQLDTAEAGGVSYPVLVVPSHGSRPVVAIADGPMGEKGRRVGINLGRIYIRSSGPESVEIRSPDDWNDLLERCLAQRADLLSKIMRQHLARSSRPSREATETLLAAVDQTAQDFASQAEQLAREIPAADSPWLGSAGQKHSVLAYAMVGEDGELIGVDNIRGRIQRASVGMHQYAYNGWLSFYPVPVPERAPQMRQTMIQGQEQHFLEGMRIKNTAVLSSAVEYWRFYEAGIGVIAESFREDSRATHDGSRPKLKVLQSLFRIHSLLAHARLMGQELPGLSHVVIRLDFRGIAGRWLTWDDHHVASGGAISQDEFKKTISLSWPELRDTYVESLRKVYIPFFDAFPNLHGTGGDLTVTKDMIEREFRRFDSNTVRLFED